MKYYLTVNKVQNKQVIRIIGADSPEEAPSVNSYLAMRDGYPGERTVAMYELVDGINLIDEERG